MKTKIYLLLLKDITIERKLIIDCFFYKTEISPSSKLYHSRDLPINLVLDPILHDVVIIDLYSLTPQTIEQILEKIKCTIKYSCILTTGFSINETLNFLEFLDVSYSFLDQEKLIKSNSRESITTTLSKLGISYNVKGYHYLKDSIYLSQKNPTITKEITKKLYPKIGEIHNSNPKAVERAIRNAIEIGWIRGCYNLTEQIFGNTIDIDKNKPTNTEFIIGVTEYLNRNI